MANVWENAVITNKGVALNSKVMAGGRINITSVKSGSGTVSTALLMAQTSVSGIKQTLSTKPIQKNGNTTILPVMLENDGLTSAYDLRQVGIYAEDPDEGEILYMLAQNTQARHVPSEDEIPGYSLVWNFHLTVANGVEMDVNVNPAGAVPLDKYEKEVGAMHDASLTGYYVHDGESFGGYASNAGVDIGTIKGNSFQEKSNGYQLFDAKSVKTQSSGGATVTNNNDGSFTITGSGNLTSAFETRYHISHEDFTRLFRVGLLRLKTEKVTYPFMYVNLYKANSFVQTIFSNKWQASSSFELKQEYFDGDYSLYIGFNGAVGETMISGTVKPLLYQDGEGTWEPFTGGKVGPCPEYPLDIKSFEVDRFDINGGNLFDQSKIASYSANGAVLKNNGDGSFTISGSGALTGSFSSQYRITHDEFVKLLHVGTLNLKSVLSRPYFSVRIANSATGETLADLTHNNKTCEVTQEMMDNQNIVMIFQFYAAEGETVITGTNKPVLWQDGTGEYYPYNADSVSLESEIVLRSLPNGVHDTYENGVITRRVGCVVLDGSEDDWVLDDVYNNISQFACCPDNVVHNVDQYGIKIISTHFKGEDWMNSWGKDNSIVCYQGGQKIRIMTSKFSSVDDFKNWLSENNVTILYELEEPVTEQVELPTLPSYYPYTNIIHDSGLASGGIVWNIKTKADGDFLPTSGGDLTGDLNLVRSAVNILRSTGKTSMFSDINDKAYMRYLSSGGTLVELMIDAVSKGFSFGVGTTSSVTHYEVLTHKNKPTGSYNGNGSVSFRSLNIGGSGNMVLITSTGGAAFVTPMGAMCFKDSVVICVSSNEAAFIGGVLELQTESDFFNNGSYRYYYQVL